MVDLIVIGAGPAGLSAAIYAARAGHTVTVLEELVFGGQVATTPEVENYPAIRKIDGVEFSMNLYNQATELGAKVEFAGATKVDLTGPVKQVWAGETLYEAKAVILANGAKRRKLDVPGEERLSGKGVSYCATCDGAFYRGKVTAIVGGGNTALEDALFLANNCETVHLIHRRDSFRGSKILSDAVIARKNIVIHYDSIPTEIVGESTVEGLSISNVKTGAAETIPVSGVFVAVGLAPDNHLVEGQLELENGYVKAGEDCATNLPGVFVAGDTRTKAVRQIITAASDGAVAAVNASTYLSSLAAE